MTKTEAQLLRDLSEALDHWLYQYASEQCDRYKVRRSSILIWDAGGTLAYIATLRARIKDALKKEKQT